MNIGLKRSRWWWIEAVMVVAILSGITYSVFYLNKYQYLPQPFFYDSSDTWMDWFNTARWAHSENAYDVWGSVYPPLTFIFIALTSVPNCYAGAGRFEYRDCDWASIATLNGFILLNTVLLAFIFYKHDKNTAFFRTIGAAFGLPMLIGWERGQIFVVCFTCFILAHGPLIRKAWVRWFFAGLSINFKIYLLTSLFGYLIRRRWQWFEGALIATIIIYIVSLAIYGHGTPLEMFGNISAYAQTSGSGFVQTFLDIWTGATYNRIMAFATSAGPVLPMVGSHKLEFIATYIPIFVRFGQLTLGLACLAVFFRPEAIPRFRAVNLVVCLTIISYEAGDYSLQLVIFLTFLERWQGVGRSMALFMCYILCVPADIFVDPLLFLSRASFLNGPPVVYVFWIVYGPFIRPGLVILIGVALAMTTIKQVWFDVRVQGWKDRRRARFDLQFFKRGGRVPPAADEAVLPH